MERRKVESYKDLIVWQKSMDLVCEIYHLTKNFPPSELYGLTSQMRRCAVSIPSNIAEGRRRGTRRDYRQFLIIAFGSGAELETQLEIVKRLKFTNDAVYTKALSLLDEIMRMLNKMTAELNSTSY